MMTYSHHESSLFAANCSCWVSCGRWSGDS